MVPTLYVALEVRVSRFALQRYLGGRRLSRLLVCHIPGLTVDFGINKPSR